MWRWLAIAVLEVGCARIAGLDDIHAAEGSSDAPPVDAPTCTAIGTIAHPANEGSAHTTNDLDPVTYVANPPASGTHYPDWGHYGRTYTTPLPRGFWVHNLEHSGIVFLYNCTDCDTEIAELTAIMSRLPADGCAPPVRVRALVTADPMLPPAVRIAAAAWDRTYVNTCLNVAELEAFAAESRGNAPEPTQCDDGQFPNP